MDSTKKFWVIANFELITTIILAIIIIPLYAIFIGDWNVSDLIILIFLIITPFALAATPPSLIEGIASYLIVVALLVYSTIWRLPHEISEYQGIVDILAVVFVGVSIIGVFLACFTHKNFYEIVSLRALYSHSAVSLFEEQWKYTLDRFCYISFSIMEGIIAIVFTIVWCTL